MLLWSPEGSPVIAAQPVAQVVFKSIISGGLNEVLLWSPEGSLVLARGPVAPGIRWHKYAASRRDA